MFERPIMLVFLVGFIIFGSFGMIALLTGVISETMFEKNALRQEEELGTDEGRHSPGAPSGFQVIIKWLNHTF